MTRVERIICHACGSIESAVVMVTEDGRLDRIHRCGSCQTVTFGMVWVMLPWLGVLARVPRALPTLRPAGWA